MRKVYLQRTIANPAQFSGRGLHTGKKVTLTLTPAPPDTGINFIRTDIKEEDNRVQASICNLSATTRATSLKKGAIRVTTVEHLLSALYVLGVDNLFCSIDAEELPILDGSCAPFIQAIRGAGIETQSTQQKCLIVKKPIIVEEDEKYAKAVPSKEFILDYSISFDHPAIGKQRFCYTSETNFEEEIAPCRTFGFLADVERMRAMGLGLGGSLENTIVLDELGVMNPEGLRFRDEFVRHKVLDAIGDFSLCGYPILASFKLHKSGHKMQTALIQKLMAEKDAFSLEIPRQLDTKKAASQKRSAYA